MRMHRASHPRQQWQSGQNCYGSPCSFEVAEEAAYHCLLRLSLGKHPLEGFLPVQSTR